MTEVTDVVVYLFAVGYGAAMSALLILLGYMLATGQKGRKDEDEERHC